MLMWAWWLRWGTVACALAVGPESCAHPVWVALAPEADTTKSPAPNAQTAAIFLMLTRSPSLRAGGKRPGTTRV